MTSEIQFISPEFTNKKTNLFVQKHKKISKNDLSEIKLSLFDNSYNINQ